MNVNIRDLSRYGQEDVEKRDLIDGVLKEFSLKIERLEYNYCEDDFMDVESSPAYDYEECEDNDYIKPVLREPEVELPAISKYCPECGRTYPDHEVVCLDCSVRLKNLSDKLDVSEIESDFIFMVDGKNDFKSFDELLGEDNLARIDEFDLAYGDYEYILHEIKSQAFRNFDKLVKENEIDFDGLDILEKIILFAKSFVKVDYKSYGGELGYFEKDTISIDDRQSKSLQITTLIHELSHFLLQEILVHVLCRLLDASRNPLMESVVAFILSYIPFTRLIDEYAAHNVEGRFTLFGFQDYSSFIQIERSLEGEMSRDEIEITKSIGNNFAVSIKEILEALIDRPLREDIKDQFRKDVLDRPNYDFLSMENCRILNEEGFLKAIWLILNDGCRAAALNIEKLSLIMDR